MVTCIFVEFYACYFTSPKVSMLCLFCETIRLPPVSIHKPFTLLRFALSNDRNANA